MKLTVSFILSLITVFAVLLFMSRLVSADHSRGLPSVPIDVLNETHNYDLSLKDRSEPDKVKPKKTDSVAEPVKQPDQPRANNKPVVITPSFPVTDTLFKGTKGFDVDVPGVNHGIATHSGPSVRVEPIYPRQARLKNLDGFVSLSFDINEQGQVININVLEANPKRVFEKAAIQALKKWQFPVKDGKQQSQTITLEFKMAS